MLSLFSRVLTTVFPCRRGQPENTGIIYAYQPFPRDEVVLFFLVPQAAETADGGSYTKCSEYVCFQKPE